jgi:hypothetical protein
MTSRRLQGYCERADQQRLVMPRLDPGIHHLRKKMDCRVKARQ